MERTQSEVVGATFFQLHITSHHLDNVDAIQQILQETLRYHDVRSAVRMKAPITW
jgi:hypothetical protein